MSIVALLGLGAMGQRIAINLLQAGHELHVWNSTRERCLPLVEQGAIAHSSPREAAQQAGSVITMLRDDEASRAVWLDEKNGALAGMAEGAIAIESSTLSLAWCHELAAGMASRGVNCLIAPVVGSRPQAEARQLIYLVGGDKNDLDKVKGVLQANATGIHHVGDQRAGMAMKLAVNAFFSVQVAALGELLGFLARQAIETSFAVELLARLPVTSPAANGAAAAIASGNYAPMFPIELVHKDLCYVSAADLKSEGLPMTASVLDVFNQAIQCGYGAENIHAVAKLFDRNR